jgi:membrane protease subunit (stomatin/prohibitin family)
MGLIKAAAAAAGGVFSDMWREFFYCDSMDADTLAMRAFKRRGKHGSNSGNDNIISNGSIITVADGQCMMIVEQGKVVEMSAEPGEFVYDTSTEPSIFYGGLGRGMLDSFKTFGKRFTFGGDAPKEQRVYYFNTKEIMDNRYGTANPIPFRVVDKNIGLDVEIAIRCNGQYSFRITDPMRFYVNVCGNMDEVFLRDNIKEQLNSELLTALQPAFAQVSEKGVRYSSLPGHAMEIAKSLNDLLSSKWKELRGIEIVAFAINSLKASDEDEKMIKELQRTAVFRNPGMAAANLAGAQADAMRSAASNTSTGPMFAFAGMNMARQAGGIDASTLYGMDASGAKAAGQTDGQAFAVGVAGNAGTSQWKCPKCGAMNTGRFCSECGTQKPAEKKGWKCPKCGTINKGRFCTECGTKKPDNEPLYRCDKCGWEPEDPHNPPKFCPQCGDPFDDSDKVQ